MKILHTKSPCCRGRIIKFGKRRRQCTVCEKTWSIRKKKRGRKPVRIKQTTVIKYLVNEKLPFRSTVSKKTVRRRVSLSLKKYLDQTSWEYPTTKGPFIIIADAMWQMIERQMCCVYFVLLRPVGSTTAWILPPCVVPGGESAFGWQITLDCIPDDLRKQIKAIVCDGDPHLVYQARVTYGWLIQRCHFHLLASIKNYATTGPLSRNLTLGKMVLTAVRTALTATDDLELEEVLLEIQLLSKYLKNKKLRARLRGLLKYIDDFRTYKKYPELDLPVTSNAAESLVQCVRNLQYRARGFRTISSFMKWIRALCLVKKTIVCNGVYQQKKCL